MTDSAAPYCDRLGPCFLVEVALRVWAQKAIYLHQYVTGAIWIYVYLYILLNTYGYTAATVTSCSDVILDHTTLLRMTRPTSCPEQRQDAVLVILSVNIKDTILTEWDFFVIFWVVASSSTSASSTFKTHIHSSYQHEVFYSVVLVLLVLFKVSEYSLHQNKSYSWSTRKGKDLSPH